MIQDIKVNNITKIYNNEFVLKEYSWVFHKGSISCIMGKSGVGKTTLLRIMMGLEKPDSGTVNQNGRISPVFQEDRLLDNISPVGNVKLVLSRNVSSEQIEQELCCVLPQECLHKRTKELSGGMRRRVSIVRAMMQQSDAVFMDEPFTGLDLDTRRVVINYIRTHRQGRTMVVVTHDEQDVKELGADICVLTSS
jgi:NitT/TauT family transport system ATP-binding protein